MAEKSREINFDRLGKLKGFTGGIVEQAIEGVLSGAIKTDLTRDYYTRGELLGKLEKIKDCSSILEIRHYEDDTKTVHNGNFCRVPVGCASCAHRVSTRRKISWAGRLERAAARFPYVYFVTMTIKDSPDVENRLDTLIEAKKNFRLMGQRRGDKFSGGEWSKIQAAISNTEIKLTAAAHVHEHLLGFSSEYLDYEIYHSRAMIESLETIYGRGCVPESDLNMLVKEWYIPKEGKPWPVSKLSKEWAIASGEQGRDIQIEYLSYKKYKADPWRNGYKCKSFPEWVRVQAAEVLKYNSKLAEDFGKNPVSPAQYVELLQRRGSRRLFNSFGAFRRKSDPLYFSEAKQEYLDYVAERDKKRYSIHPAKFGGGQWFVGGAVPAAIFSNSDKPSDEKRRRLSEQGKIVGEYRKSRAGVFAGRGTLPAAAVASWCENAETSLNDLRAIMKERLKMMWRAPLPDIVAAPA